VSQPFFAKASDAAVGSFHYPYGLVEFNLSDEAAAMLQNLGSVKTDGRDVDHLTRLAYEATSYFHEMRHFIDTFGTIAGLSLFAGRLKLLNDFAALCTALRSSGMRWEQMPVAWARDAKPPPLVRDLVRRAQAFDLGSEIFIAPFTPVEVEGHHDELRVEMDYERGGKADATPLRLVRVNAEGKQRQRTVWYPLGFETMIECTAHGLARTFVEHHFPDEVAKRFERRAWAIRSTADAQGSTDQRAAQTATPYMAVDILVTRFLRAHGIERFPRDLLLTLVDRVLSTSHIHAKESTPGTTEIHSFRPGAMLMEVLEQGQPQGLVTGTLPDAPEVTRAYASMLEAYEKGGDWTEIKDDQTPPASLAIWETYLAKRFVVPLLRERLNGGDAFTTYAGFWELLKKIGNAPVRVVNGRMLLDEGMPTRVKQAWFHQLMLSEIMRQTMRSSGPVFCPRAAATVPGLATMNLAFDGGCDAHVRLGCGTYRHLQPAVATPNCLFEGTLKVCGLERK
jgi:hypothetical protein